MLGISYETWKSTCQMYFGLDNSAKTAYLQWFPFTKISREEELCIISEAFYERYIRSGAFVFSPEMMHCSENYIQKGDGSFRDSSLLSPILYLVLQAIGKEVSTSYRDQRTDRVEVYYAGNYNELHPNYKQDYDSFFKSINEHIDGCQFFIKTDLSNFFSSINVNTLIDRIDIICNKNSVRFTQAHMATYREILLYCGKGRFPLVENSIASSYLSTVVYLDEIDKWLAEFIEAYISCFENFKMIRYVDDLYILISSDKSEAEIHYAYNQIRNEYSSILNEFGLALNTRKCCIKPAGEINAELKKSLYDERIFGETHRIEELFSGSLTKFLEALYDVTSNDSLDTDRYNTLIEECFNDTTIEFTASEIYNYYVYENKEEVKSDSVIAQIIELINRDVSFISFDPKRLSVLIIKTGSPSAIKALLNQLFKRHRAGLWNSYDTTIAVSYLIQSGFKHIDLIDVLGQHSQSLDNYYNYFCRTSFLNRLKNRRLNSYCSIVGSDWKTVFLYFMYLVECERHNSLAQFAFYKNFFDRFTANMAFCSNYEKGVKKPNYKRFYRETELKKFYDSIPGAFAVIENAHNIRNANPLSHASAELIDTERTSIEINLSIREMGKLIDDFLKRNNL